MDYFPEQFIKKQFIVKLLKILWNIKKRRECLTFSYRWQNINTKQ